MNIARWGDLQPTRHDFAVSYSTRDTLVVKPIVELLVSRGYRVFEYVNLLEQAWGRDLAAHLDEVFGGSAACYVAFLSQDYLASRWTQHEWSAMRMSAQRGPWRDIAIIELDGSPVVADHRCRVLVRGGDHKDPARIAELLARQLLELEGIPIMPAKATTKLALVVSSLRSVDQELLLGSLATGACAGCDILVRLPPDLHTLYSGVRRALAGQWPYPYPECRQEAEKLVDELQTATLPRIADGIHLLMSLSPSSVWSREDVARGVEAYFLAKCFQVVRRFAGFRSLYDEVFTKERDYFRHGGSSIEPHMSEALAWVLQREGDPTTFWTNVDVHDRQDGCASLRKVIYVPSDMYFPTKLACSPQQLMRFIVPQLIDHALSRGDESMLRVLMADPRRVDLWSREEWLIETVNYSTLQPGRTSRAVSRARSETEQHLHRLIASGRLHDGLEHIDAKERVGFHMGHMPFKE